MFSAKQMLYFPRDGQVIFDSFFFRPAALQMLAVALATPALCALQVKKIKFAKISPFHPEGSISKFS